VRRLLDLRDFWFSQPSHFVRKQRSDRKSNIIGATLGIGIGLALMVAWYISGQVTFGIIGAFPVIICLCSIVWGGKRTRLDQFRLCPTCGFNLTGNTTGKCPECGGLV
jgi:hypothetical protein